MSLAAVNLPKYATTINGGVCQLGSSGTTVGATALGVDGIAADAKVCYMAGSFGGIVESLMASTTDTAAVNVLVYALSGTSVQPLGIVNVPLSSGNAANVPNVDLINGLAGLPINSVYKKYIPLQPNMSIKVAVLAAMTANKILFVKATGVDFVA
jgi:hypothetical protein